MDRLRIMQTYINHRLENRVSELLDLFADQGELISLEGVTYKGKMSLAGYYNIPVSVTPSVDMPMMKDGIYYIDLSFALGLRTVRSFFEFDKNNKIIKIKLESVGWI